MNQPRFLSFDIGGSKTAWASFSPEGVLLTGEVFVTPQEKDRLLALLEKVIDDQKPTAIGIGIAGTVSPNHEDVLVCTNLPELSHLQLATFIREKTKVPVVAIENDARCALIGEVWQGVATEMSSAVMLTLGTGVGGAVMQKGVILPHPQDLSRELSRLVVDPTDIFPSPTGKGTMEALIGGKNLQNRFGIELADISERVRKNDSEAKEIWREISGLFIDCIRAIHMTYSCKNIIIGGGGSKDLKFYLQDNPPCPVVAAKLENKAGLYGAARLAMDLLEDEQNTSWE